MSAEEGGKKRMLCSIDIRCFIYPFVIFLSRLLPNFSKTKETS